MNKDRLHLWLWGFLFLLLAPTATAETIGDLNHQLGIESADKLLPVTWQPEFTVSQVDTNNSKADDDEIEITVTGQKLIFTPTSSPIYIVPKEDIEKQRSNSLAEILRGLPGFAINDVGFGADIHTGTFYRGQAINESVFLFNGRSIGSNISTYHGGTDLSAIPVDAIERVELSSGTASTLYGSEAFGGIVNIVTKKQIDPPKANAGIEFGSYGYSRFRLNYGGSSNAISYFLGYERVSADNRYPVPVGAANRGPDGNLFNGDRAMENFYGSLGIKLNDRNTISFDGYKTSSRRGLIYFGFPLQRDRLDHDLLNFGVSLDSKLGDGDDSRLLASLGLNWDYFNTYGPTGGTFSRIGTLDSKAITARVEHQWQTSVSNNLTWGLDFQTNFLNGTALSTSPSAIANNEVEDRSRIRAALFALNTWKITDTFQLEFGLRQNFTNDFGSYLNPSVGTRWSLAPNVAVRGSFATVQRNPGLDQLYVFDTVHGWFPNPNLKPETGTAYTAGIDVNLTENLTGQFTYFGNSLNDRLAVVSGRWDNVGLVTTNGLELGLRWNISPQFYSLLNYTYTDAKIGSGAETGLQLSTIPFSVGKLGFGYEESGWEANIFLSYYSGSRRAIFASTGTSSLDFSPPYLNLDLSGKLPISKNFALNLYLENLANVSYEKTNRIYQPGITYRVGVQATF